MVFNVRNMQFYNTIIRAVWCAHVIILNTVLERAQELIKTVYGT